MRIAVDEINTFLLNNEMEIYLVVFDDRATSLGGKIYPDLEQYIDQNYVEDKRIEEYGAGFFDSANKETGTPYRRPGMHPDAMTMAAMSGVEEFKGVSHHVIPDRIETGKI